MNSNSCSGKRIAVTRQSTTERYTVTALQYKIHFHPQKWQTLRQRKYPANVLILWMLWSKPQSVIGLYLLEIAYGEISYLSTWYAIKRKSLRDDAL